MAHLVDPQGACSVDTASRKARGIENPSWTRADTHNRSQARGILAFDFFTVETPWLRTLYVRFARDVRLPFLDRLGKGLAGRDAAQALEEYLGQVEARIAEIGGRRSRHFWLHLSRRIPPVPLEGVGPWTTLLYRTVFALALLKYGRSADGGDDFEVDPGSGTLVPSSLRYEDCRDIYDLEYLAFEFNRAATAYRRVGKGAVLRRGADQDFDTEATPEVERLMQLLDRRVERYNSLFSWYGSSLDVSMKALRGGAEAARWFIPFAALNVEQAVFPPQAAEFFGVEPTGPLNYIPAFLPANPIRELLALYEPQVVQSLGVPPDRLVAFLSAVGLHEFLRISSDQRWAIQFFQRGYWVIQESVVERTLDDLAETYSLVFREQAEHEVDPEAARTDVRAIFSALTYTDDELARISMWDRTPYKLVVRHGDYLLWDYSNMQSFLHGLMSEIGSLSGEVGNVKSENFENEVLELIRSTDGIDIWEAKKELIAHDGSRRQIDASFIRNDESGWEDSYGGEKWQRIVELVIELRAAIDSGDGARASRICATVTSVEHNRGRLVPSREEWQEKAYLRQKWPELCE